MSINQIDKRALKVARHMIETGQTVRATAKQFGISKSTVHKDVAIRLKAINIEKYLKVREILEKNKMERHIRGGLATKEKYENLKKTHK